MVKEDINLLAPEVRKKRVRTIYSRRITRLYNTIVFGCVILFAVYGVAYWVMYQSRAALSNQLMSQEESSDVEGKVRDVNQRLGAIYAKVTGRMPWSLYIQQITKALPAGVVISELEVQESTDILTITGTAGERTAVLALEDKIQALSWVKAVEAPLQNFASGQRTEFTITVERKDLTIGENL